MNGFWTCMLGNFSCLIFMFWFSRLSNAWILHYLLNNSNRRKRKKGQSFLDWFLYRRFYDVLPLKYLLFYFGNLLGFVLSSVTVAILYFFVKADLGIVFIPLRIYIIGSIFFVSLQGLNWNWFGRKREWGPEYEFERKGRNKK